MTQANTNKPKPSKTWFLVTCGALLMGSLGLLLVLLQLLRGGDEERFARTPSESTPAAQEGQAQPLVVRRQLRHADAPPIEAPVTHTPDVEGDPSTTNDEGTIAGEDPRTTALNALTQDVLQNEPRDHAWASAMETQVRQRVAASEHGVTIEQLECASSRCAAKFKVPDRDALSEMDTWFGDGKIYYEATPDGSNGYSASTVFTRRGFTFDGQKRLARRE